MDTLRNKGHEDAEFTFVHMFIDNAFHFTATSSEVSFHFFVEINYFYTVDLLKLFYSVHSNQCQSTFN